MSAYQTCRVCGVRVPAGFTNCDGCYHKADAAEAKGIKPLKHLFPILEKLKPILVPKAPRLNKPLLP